ncbi:MAG: 50S ribosomal protein L25 [Proteobacteria bacterium]|nr:50S ribosomal protein L25 [Pseudomonadota bacterium]MBU1708925.1 50S ribosomal protein L25 [Pseudomonadota bacterium]
MIQMDLTAQVRENFGKGASRTLRRDGLTPAILYGPKIEPMSLQLDSKSFTKTLLAIHRRHAVITLDIEVGKKKETKHVMIREIQTHPVKDSLVHVDFVEVSLEEPSTLKVPIRFTGKAKGVDLGGELHVSVAEVALQGKLLDIPDFIEIEVTNLNIGDDIKCNMLDIPANIKLIGIKGDSVCVSVQHAISAPAEGAEGAAAASKGAEVSSSESPAKE